MSTAARARTTRWNARPMSTSGCAQAQMWETATARLLDEIGLAP